MSDGDQRLPDQAVEIPYRQLAPETLQRLLEEFVSRDGADWGEAGGTLAEKVARVRQQLDQGRVRIVFDAVTQTANLVPTGLG